MIRIFGVLMITIITQSALMTYSPAVAEPSGEWVFVGLDGAGTGAKVYTRPDYIENWEDGNYFAPSLTVYRVMIRGVDFPDGSGGVWTDTTKPFRSMMTWGVYDCPRRLVAISERHYFSSENPSNGTLIFMEKDGDPKLYPEMFRDPMLDHICNG